MWSPLHGKARAFCCLQKTWVKLKHVSVSGVNWSTGAYKDDATMFFLFSFTLPDIQILFQKHLTYLFILMHTLSILNVWLAFVCNMSHTSQISRLLEHGGSACAAGQDLDSTPHLLHNMWPSCLMYKCAQYSATGCNHNEMTGLTCASSCPGTQATGSRKVFLVLAVSQNVFFWRGTWLQVVRLLLLNDLVETGAENEDFAATTSSYNHFFNQNVDLSQVCQVVLSILRIFAYLPFLVI